MPELSPQIATTDSEIENCFDVMAELRTHLGRNTFLKTVRDMEQQGFQLAYLKDNDNVVAVAGYRIASNLFLGKHLYIDDIVTSQKVRSRGYGDANTFISTQQCIAEIHIVFILGRGCQFQVFTSGKN